MNVLALQGRVNQLFSNKAHSYYKPASPFATRTNSRLNSFNEDVSELLALQSTAVANTINELQTLLKNFNVDSITKALTDKSLVDEISKIDFREVAKVSNSFQGFSFPSIADIQSLLNSIGNVDSKSLWHLAEVLAAEPSFLPSFLAVVFILVVFGVGYDDRLVDSPYAKGDYKYDADACDRYYSSRFSFVFKRLFKLLTITGGFNIRLLLDYQFGDVQKNEAQRAKEALALATQLGPTFIKLGQALSIRTDLIPEPYALELRKLQDAVPPFDSENARKIICEELEISSINEVFSTLSDKPVASASIGQVYRGKLIGGTEVAVKVQRPNILKEISLDLYLLRKLTPLQVIIANQGRTAKLDEQDFENAFRFVDAWGQGLVAEVDYQLEASNTKAFGEAMKARGLDAVVAPTVVDPLTRSRVLVTEWVEGTRLDRDASADVPRYAFSNYNLILKSAITSYLLLTTSFAYFLFIEINLDCVELPLMHT